MRVVHLCTMSGTAGGGATRASYRLHQALRSQGVDSSVLTMSSNSDDPDVHILGRATMGEQIRRLIGQKFEGLVRKYARPLPGNIWTSGLVGTLSVDQHPDIARADVIVLYWVGFGFLSIARIGRLLRLGKPVVWRLSDMWPFTGGCHYSSGCDRYRERCGHCPELRSSHDFDLSRLVWRRKRAIWQTQSLTVVCPSTWMAKCVRQSSLLAAVDVRIIHTGVDVTLYRPSDRMAARDLLGLPRGARIVLSGADGLSFDSGRKGTGFLLDAISRVRVRIPDVHLAVFGASHKPEGIPCTSLGVIRDERLLALAYTAADLFVSTSLEDNLPNTILEALASGLPVVAFGIEGVLDAIRDGHTGFLSPPGNAEDLASNISRCLLDDQGRLVMAKNAREEALASFDANRQATKYATLLEELCTHHRRAVSSNGR
jgi:glycosyltransferase involved in cell wall biosynthesis